MLLALNHLTIMASFLLAPSAIPLDQVPQLVTTDADTQRIYFVRHGESAFNQPDSNGIRYTSGKSLDIPLTNKGEEQAIQLGKKLIGKIPSDESIVILSSTALRAQETASRLFDELKYTHMVKRGESYDGLCELGQGDWEGKPKDAKYEEELRKWEILSAADKFNTAKLETGESYQAVAKRALEDLQKIIERYPNETIIIVSHYAAMNAMALQWSGRTSELSSEPETKLPSVALDNCDMLLVEVPVEGSIEQAQVKMHIQSTN